MASTACVIDLSGPRPLCDDCNAELDEVAVDHGKMHVSHYRRCCACWDKRQGVLPSSQAT